MHGKSSFKNPSSAIVDKRCGKTGNQWVLETVVGCSRRPVFKLKMHVCQAEVLCDEQRRRICCWWWTQMTSVQNVTGSLRCRTATENVVHGAWWWTWPAEQVMGWWVMGQWSNGSDFRWVSHMGHGSVNVDPWPITHTMSPKKSHLWLAIIFT